MLLLARWTEDTGRNIKTLVEEVGTLCAVFEANLLNHSARTSSERLILQYKLNH